MYYVPMTKSETPGAQQQRPTASGVAKRVEELVKRHGARPVSTKSPYSQAQRRHKG
jgi:hypothetical protein